MIVILNGPPGSGKDTIANYFVEHHPEYYTDSFKSALYKETCDLYGFNITDFIRVHNNRDLKEEPYYFGLSTRQLLIDTSENHIKPVLGDDYFGALKGFEWKLMMDLGASFIISDGGFAPETNAVCDIVGFENVVIIRLLRDGYTFEGDSRDYIRKSESKCSVYDLHLFDGEVGKACAEINNIINNL